jgi:outer membrane protein OmpA-like peptidoglycan-associated protein
MKNSISLKVVLIFSLLLIYASTAFAQADLPRQTTAITYPQNENVTVQFRGTTRFPRMKGEAKIKRTTRNITQIDLSVSKMPRPIELGAGYATYVLWAISPDGHADNLGEIKRRGFWEFDSKISVTSTLQSFALIVTAEPHFLVRRPSRVVMLENLNPSARSGRVIPVAKTVQFFGNSSDYFRDSRTPEIAEIDYQKTPSTVLQAQQALALARYAGADRDAREELQQAESLLQSADDGWRAGRPEDQIDITARQAISAAVKAEETAYVRRAAREKRNEKIQQDAELAKSENKVADAQRLVDDLRAELAAEQRSRELAERDAQNYNEQVKQLRAENAKLREDLFRARSESEDAKVRLARYEGERQVIDAQRERENRLVRLKANVPVLIQSLKPYGEVRQTERGLIVTLNDTYWTGARSNNVAAAAESKLANLANVLSANQDYKIMVEAHTDNQGTPADLQGLSESRAAAIMERLTNAGVEPTRVEATGFGASLPVAPNTTVANRGKNRRVEVVLIPSID